jgi:8-oxo-dGTP diphosphatase
MSRIIVDPPLIACPHCGGENLAVTMKVSGMIRELHSMRLGTAVNNEDMWSDMRLSKPSKHVVCADCEQRIGTIVGYGPSIGESDEPVRKVIRISTLGIVEDGRIMLVRKRGLDMFILPGGKQEPGESDIDALLRELREEIGCRIRGRPKFVGVFRDAAGGAPGVDVEVTMHKGTLIGTPTPMAEIEEIRWVSLERPEVPVAPSLSNLIMPYLLAMHRREKA